MEPKSQPDISLDVTVDHPERGLFTTQTVAKAFGLYVTHGMNPGQISETLGIPENVVEKWRDKNKWALRRRELVRELVEAEEQKLAKFIAKNRMPAAERLLETSKEIEEAIRDKIKLCRATADPERGIDLKVLGSLARALSEVAGVTIRVVGISERPVEDIKAAQESRQPLIQIGVMPVPREKQAEVVIETTCVDKETKDERNDSVPHAD